MKQVLYIGPDYKNHRGGIGAVLEVYAANITPFKFIPTYYSNASAAKRLLAYCKAVIRLIVILSTDKEIRILHIHNASRGSFLRKSFLLMIGKLFGKKTILHIHGGGFDQFYARTKLLKPYIRFILGKADLVICLSDKWKAYYASAFRLKRLEKVNNVIEEAPVFPEPSAPDGRLRLLFLGLICDDKGIFDLLDVLAANPGQFRDRVSVTIAGNGETTRLQTRIKEDGLSGEAAYAGWVNGAEKAKLLAACDIYILPSYHEGLPVSILEAMAYAKPVIATDVGGIPEIVKPGYNGWLFKPGDKRQLLSILKQAIDDPGLLREYGRRSLALSQAYRPEAVMRSLEALYEALLEKSR
ncbi:MAG: glycosyltransferase family 4 protein [Chitinophagaceae bacterium]|nr:glycosyltransferase family 4 protein [Chitinophagaceae bacterium]